MGILTWDTSTRTNSCTKIDTIKKKEGGGLFGEPVQALGSMIPTIVGGIQLSETCSSNGSVHLVQNAVISGEI